MSNQSASFEVILEDSVTGNADRVVNSLKKIQSQSTSVSNSVIKSQDKMEAATKGTTSSTLKSGEAIKKLGDFGKAIGGPFSALSEHLEKFGKVGGESAGEISGGMMVTGAVIALVAYKVAQLTVELIKFAFSSADAARSAHLLAEGASASEQAASDLEDQILSLGNKVGISKDKITEMGLELSRTGLQGDALASALSAVAVSSSAAGDAVASKLKTIAENAQEAGKFLLKATDLKGTGLATNDIIGALAKNLGISFAQAKSEIDNGTASVSEGLDALNSAVESKFGGIAGKQALSLTHQIDQLKSNLVGLFAGVDIEPLLEGMHDLFSLFDQSTASGKFLKDVLSDLFGPIASIAGSFFSLAKIGFQEIEIAILRLLIFFAPLINAFKAIANSIDFSGLISMLKVIGTVIGGIILANVASFIAIFLVAASVIGIVIKIFTGFYNLMSVVRNAIFDFAMSFQPVRNAVEAISSAFDNAITGVSKFWTYISNLDFQSIGSSIIDGLVNGITSGVGLVIDAITGLGTSAMSALKGVLGIHSPSTVFKGFGNYTAEGFAQGVDDGSAKVNDSVTDMVSYPKMDNNTTNNSGSNQKSINIENLNVNGVSADASDLVEKIQEALINFMSGQALITGADLDEGN